MRYIALMLVGFFTVSAYAVTTVELYDAEIVIADVDNAERQARVEGMKQVLVRASGTESIVSNEVVTKALRQSDQYLSQISYGQKNDQPTLMMKFNGRQIQSLLTQSKLPYWPERRENILVWLVEDESFERSIAWETSESHALQWFQHSAQVRGLPFTVPIGDFDDVTGVNVSEFWGNFSTPIAQASLRYPVDAVLLIRKQGSQARWSLYEQAPAKMMNSQQTPVSGVVSGTSQEQMQQLVSTLAEFYAAQNALEIGSESSLSALIEVDGIVTANDFFALENHLKAMNVVASVDVVNIQGSSVTFRVHLLTGMEDFEKELLKVKRLQIQSESDANSISIQPETHGMLDSTDSDINQSSTPDGFVQGSQLDAQETNGGSHSTNTPAIVTPSTIKRYLWQ